MKLKNTEDNILDYVGTLWTKVEAEKLEMSIEKSDESNVDSSVWINGRLNLSMQTGRFLLQSLLRLVKISIIFISGFLSEKLKLMYILVNFNPHLEK